MSKHTPGPWSVAGTTVYALEHEGWHRGRPVFRNRFDARTQGSHCPPDELEANARLIAAAPDLLEALIAMEAEKSDYMRRNNLGNPASEDTNKMARAAIAKATGE